MLTIREHMLNRNSPMNNQKEKLISATERLLCSRGLACVSTRDIAHAAKVAEGALYHHFDDKAELILSVVLHQLGDFPEVLRSLPLQVGQKTVQKNLGRVLGSAFAFHYRIAPLVCSLFADQELLVRVRSMMHERSMGPGRTTSVIAAYLRAEQQLGRVLSAAVPETVADLMLAVSFNTALRDHFFCGGSGGEAKAQRQLREAVRALVVGLGPRDEARRAREKR
ncbi:MAG TPA: helix-turn-helix domain-containing protein [Burkholderiales bacterium]